jgi:amino acid transporter
MKATVLTCVVIGFLSAAEVYIAQLIWPASQAFPNMDTAYVYAAARTWAPLFGVVGFTLIVANFGSGLGAQIGAARLLFGMGRSNALPKSFFGAVDAKHRIPRNNVLFVGAIALVGAFLISYDLGLNMLNFGALIAFMGVNAAALIRYFVRVKHDSFAHLLRNIFSNLIPPTLGFFICLLLWLNLSHAAMLYGGIWMAVGIAFGVWKTRGFREQLSFEVPPE